jgi:hypothetical protein
MVAAWRSRVGPSRIGASLSSIGLPNRSTPWCPLQVAPSFEFTTIPRPTSVPGRERLSSMSTMGPWLAVTPLSTFGNTRLGSPGSWAQSLCQRSYEFRVLLDAFGTGQFVGVPHSPALRIVGGPAVRPRVRTPVVRRDWTGCRRDAGDRGSEGQSSGWLSWDGATNHRAAEHGQRSMAPHVPDDGERNPSLGGSVTI